MLFSGVCQLVVIVPLFEWGYSVIPSDARVLSYHTYCHLFFYFNKSLKLCLKTSPSFSSHDFGRHLVCLYCR